MTPSKGHNDSVEIEPDLNQTYEVSEKKNSLKNVWDTIQKTNICIILISKGDNEGKALKASLNETEQ